jgi:hypothetical protein
MLAAVPNLRAFAISLSLRNLFRTQYRKRHREGEDADGCHVDSLKSPPEQ